MGPLESLGEVRAALMSKLQDEGKLSMLNARVILRTGVNLMQPTNVQLRDPKGVPKVLAALRDMGFEL